MGGGALRYSARTLARKNTLPYETPSMARHWLVFLFLAWLSVGLTQWLPGATRWAPMWPCALAVWALARHHQPQIAIALIGMLWDGVQPQPSYWYTVFFLTTGMFVSISQLSFQHLGSLGFICMAVVCSSTVWLGDIFLSGGGGVVFPHLLVVPVMTAGAAILCMRCCELLPPRWYPALPPRTLTEPLQEWIS